MRQKKKEDYTQEELEKAEILDAYENMLLGRELSQKEKQLAQSKRYAKELSPIKKMIRFTRKTLASAPVALSQKDEVADRRRLMTLIKREQDERAGRGKKSIILVFAPFFGEAQLEPAFAMEQGEFVDSDLVPYEYDEEEAKNQCNAIVKFEIIEGDNKGAQYAIGIVENVTLGRGKDANFQLLDSSHQMSRLHAKLEFDKDAVYITDLDSRNGTFVDGNRIEKKTKLSNGAEVKLGNVTLEILSVDCHSDS